MATGASQTREGARLRASPIRLVSPSRAKSLVSARAHRPRTQAMPKRL